MRVHGALSGVRGLVNNRKPDEGDVNLERWRYEHKYNRSCCKPNERTTQVIVMLVQGPASDRKDGSPRTNLVIVRGSGKPVEHTTYPVLCRFYVPHPPAGRWCKPEGLVRIEQVEQLLLMEV
jgi:hypothetical protein